MLLFLQSNYISGALEHSILKPYILSFYDFFFFLTLFLPLVAQGSKDNIDNEE